MLKGESESPVLCLKLNSDLIKVLKLESGSSFLCIKFESDLIKVLRSESLSPVPRLKLEKEAGEQLSAGLASREKRGIPPGSVQPVRLAFVAGYCVTGVHLKRIKDRISTIVARKMGLV